MSGFVRQAFGVLGAALLVLGSLPAPALAQDEVPDLKIDLIGLNEANRREVDFIVTNVGDHWSDDTTVTFVVRQSRSGPRVDNHTQPVGQTNPERDTSGENPHSLLITYTLPAECDGHSITAFLKPAKTFTGLAETKVGNNVALIGQLCPPKNPPAAPPATSEDKKPGQHTKTFSVGPPFATGAFRQGGGCFMVDPFQNGDVSNVVGWANAEDTAFEPGNADCGSAVRQLAVDFDDGFLDGIPGVVVNRATLAYDEAQSDVCLRTGPGTFPCWTNGDKKFENKPNGCVEVKLPTVDWVKTRPQGEIPYSTAAAPAAKRLGPREWDVTTPYSMQRNPSNGGLAAPGATAPNAGFGFLLKGGLDLRQLTGDDNAQCMSRVTNIRLNVTYTVPPPDGPGPIVK